MGRGRHWTPGEKAALWAGWKRGLTLAEIGSGLGRNGASVFQVIRRAGGFEPRARCRSMRVLSVVEREEISRGLAAVARSMAPSSGVMPMAAILRAVSHSVSCCSP